MSTRYFLNDNDTEIKKIQSNCFEYLISALIQTAKYYFLASPVSVRDFPELIPLLKNTFHRNPFHFSNGYETIAAYYRCQYANQRYLPIKDLGLPITLNDWEEHWCEYYLSEMGRLIHKNVDTCVTILRICCLPVNISSDDKYRLYYLIYNYYIPLINQIEIQKREDNNKSIEKIDD